VTRRPWRHFFSDMRSPSSGSLIASCTAPTTPTMCVRRLSSASSPRFRDFGRRGVQDLCPRGLLKPLPRPVALREARPESLYGLAPGEHAGDSSSDPARQMERDADRERVRTVISMLPPCIVKHSICVMSRSCPSMRSHESSVVRDSRCRCVCSAPQSVREGV
jgi:hypothetical protein